MSDEWCRSVSVHKMNTTDQSESRVNRHSLLFSLCWLLYSSPVDVKVRNGLVENSISLVHIGHSCPYIRKGTKGIYCWLLITRMQRVLLVALLPPFWFKPQGTEACAMYKAWQNYEKLKRSLRLHRLDNRLVVDNRFTECIQIMPFL